MKTKDYWIKVNSNRYYNCYRLRCPKCLHTFIMPKPWGVWKGCPTCWTELKYPYGKNQMNGEQANNG